MKIFLATASLSDVRWAGEHGLMDGVVTTPGMLAAEAEGDDRELLAELCRAVDAPVHAAVGALAAADIYRDARELARIADNLIVQIPILEDALVPLHRLTLEGVRVAATLVCTAAQAILAARAGAAAVAVPVDQLQTYGQDGAEVLAGMRRAFDASVAECDLLAFSPRDPVGFAGCAAAGADGVAVTPALLRALLQHPVTDRGVDQLLGELSKRPKARSAP